MPPPPRRYAARLTLAERRPQLLDAALALIVERGYAGATLDAVAERAGVTKPVIYSAFENRERFFEALLDREEQRALAAVAAAMPAPDQFLAGERHRAVADGVRGLLAAVRADPLPWRLILTESDGTPAPVRARIARNRCSIHASLTGLAATGLAADGRTDLDTALLAHAIFAVVERFVRLTAETPGAVDPAAAGAVLAALLP